MESTGTLANGLDNALAHDVAARVVRQLHEIDAGHDRRERGIAAILAHDRERRAEGAEAADRQAGPARKLDQRVRRGDKFGGTYEPVMNERNSRRSSSVNSDMIDRKSRTGRLSIVKPWSALVELARAKEHAVSTHRTEVQRTERTLDRPVLVHRRRHHDDFGRRERLQIAYGEDCRAKCQHPLTQNFEYGVPLEKPRLNSTICASTPRLSVQSMTRSIYSSRLWISTERSLPPSFSSMSEPGRVKSSVRSETLAPRIWMTSMAALRWSSD